MPRFTRADLEALAISSQVRIPSPLEHIVNEQEDASLRSPGVPAHYYRFLHALTKKYKPATVLELGTHTGISAACIAEGNPEGRVITVDIWGHLCREECRRPNIEYWVQDSEAAPKSAIHSVDVLFIDTIHDGIKCEKEYERWRPLVMPGGLVFFDDITLNEEMQNWWPKWKPEEGAEKFELPVHGGAGFGAVILPDGA